MRYWAANGRPGMDMAFDEGQMKIGRRLAIKLLNASKFALGLGCTGGRRRVTEPLDRSMLAGLAAPRRRGHRRLRPLRLRPGPRAHRGALLVVLRRLPRAGEEPGLQRRAPARSRPRPRSALALEALLKLFAPFLPYVTEEVWSWWQEGSIHRSSWPDAAADLRTAAGDGDPLVLAVAAEVLSEVRRAKSEAKRSMRAEVDQVVVTDTAERLGALDQAAVDVRGAGVIDRALLDEGDTFAVAVTLGADA